MLNLNRIEVIGNLTRDPELRFTPNNQAVCNFAIATNRSYKDQSGAWVESPPEYHDVVVWTQLGERCNQTLHKGERVFISGRLQTRSWEAQDGSKRYKTEIIADTVIGPDQVNKFQGGEGGSFAQAEPTDVPDTVPTPKSSIKKATEPAPVPEGEIDIEDIPF